MTYSNVQGAPPKKKTPLNTRVYSHNQNEAIWAKSVLTLCSEMFEASVYEISANWKL